MRRALTTFWLLAASVFGSASAAPFTVWARENSSPEAVPLDTGLSFPTGSLRRIAANPGDRSNAGDPVPWSYPWRNHAPPFDFLFGNEIDGHQQTRRADNGSLAGFFYVRFTGVVTRDGYGVAIHVDCNAFADCTVGWVLHGNPAQATYLYQVGQDHPVFLVARPDIPQPGAYAHFHWLGPLAFDQVLSGYLLQLVAVDRFCFIHHDADAARSDLSCRDNGGVNVDPGLDIATHLNIVTSRPPGL